MKTKKVLLGALAIAMTAPFFQSCKKGAEDPFLSLRSRDKRIQGTWVMKSWTATQSEAYTFDSENDVNSDNTDGKTNISYSGSYDGTKMTETWTHSYEMNATQSNYDFASNTYVASTSKEVSTNPYVKTDVRNMTIEITINKDHTWEMTTTTTEISGDRTLDMYTRTVDGASANNYDNPDTCYAGDCQGFVFYDDNYYMRDLAFSSEKVDTTYAKSSTSTMVDNGYWEWADGKKNKIYIHTGSQYFDGYLVMLKNKELKFENNDTDTDSGTMYDGREFNNYSVTNNDNIDGVETTKWTSSNVFTSTSTWEKK